MPTYEKTYEEIISAAKKEAIEEKERKRQELIKGNPKLTFEDNKKWLKEYFSLKTRPATPQDYSKWLRGYIEKGGRITNTYTYNLGDNHFFAAKEDFELRPLYGAQSVNVIIPKGITVTLLGDLGHNNLFYMNDYSVVGGWVPLYMDIE